MQSAGRRALCAPQGRLVADAPLPARLTPWPSRQIHSRGVGKAAPRSRASPRCRVPPASLPSDRRSRGGRPAPGLGRVHRTGVARRSPAAWPRLPSGPALPASPTSPAPGLLPLCALPAAGVRVEGPRSASPSLTHRPPTERGLHAVNPPGPGSQFTNLRISESDYSTSSMQ